MSLAYLTACCLPLLAQTSGVSSVTKAAGEVVTLTIKAVSQPARAPVALKWEVVFPVQLMEMETDDPEIGAAARDSGKSLQCMARKPYACICMLSGGEKPIADGTISIFHFRIKATASSATTTLRIEQAEATAVDLQKWRLNDTEVTVIIR